DRTADRNLGRTRSGGSQVRDEQAGVPPGDRSRDDEDGECARRPQLRDRPAAQPARMWVQLLPNDVTDVLPHARPPDDHRGLVPNVSMTCYIEQALRVQGA